MGCSVLLRSLNCFLLLSFQYLGALLPPPTDGAAPAAGRGPLPAWMSRFRSEVR